MHLHKEPTGLLYLCLKLYRERQLCRACLRPAAAFATAGVAATLSTWVQLPTRGSCKMVATQLLLSGSCDVAAVPHCSLLLVTRAARLRALGRYTYYVIGKLGGLEAQGRAFGNR